MMKTFSSGSFDNLELSVLPIERPFSKSFFSIRDGLNQIHSGGMGSGIAMVLSLTVLETISSMAKEEIVFLIDEPEMHLHPQLQESVFSFLVGWPSSDSLTHSEHMVNLGDWKSIRRICSSGRILPDDVSLGITLDCPWRKVRRGTLRRIERILPG